MKKNVNFAMIQLWFIIFIYATLNVKNVESGRKEKAMSKLIWKLYNNNLISIEVANELLDEHYK